MGLSHTLSDLEANIEPFSPGHYETYDLQDNGKVKFLEKVQFNKIGCAPVYKTLVQSLGKYLYRG